MHGGQGRSLKKRKKSSSNSPSRRSHTSSSSSRSSSNRERSSSCSRSSSHRKNSSPRSSSHRSRSKRSHSRRTHSSRSHSRRRKRDKHPIHKRKPIKFKKHSNDMGHNNPNKSDSPTSSGKQLKSARSVSSNESAFSMGIGNGNARHHHPSSSLSSKQPFKDLARLLPEGPQISYDPVYDCIVYLIYCAVHDRIAVTNVAKLKCVWLPFVVLQEGVTWKKASHEGVATLIGRQDPELEADEAEKTAPKYTMSYLHILRIQMPYTSKMIMRITQFVHLLVNPNFKCCENTFRVNWVPSSSIVNDKVVQLWGPEVKMLSQLLLTTQPHIIDEFPLSNTLFHLKHKDKPEYKALMDRSLTETEIYAIYNDFVEHCYPAFYMCFQSFRSYMIRHGFERDVVLLQGLFRAFLPDIRQDYISFNNFLIGLIVIDPNTSNRLEVRLRAIYRYFDTKKNGFLEYNDICRMMHMAEVGEAEFQSILSMAEHNRISFEEFIKIKSSILDRITKLCRAKHSLLAQIIKKRKTKTKDNVKHSRLKAKRDTKGTCLACRAQQYRYGIHCVTIDTIGRCVEPKIIFKEFVKEFENVEPTQRQYSMDFVYSISSIPNVFLDLVRDFYLRMNSNLIGLMANKDDRSTFTKYLRILCSELKQLLMQQDKLIKTNAPAIVIGDIQGNLRNLMRIHRLFFRTVPLLSENLIFLGNYSGCNLNGIECLIFLFSLKLMSPNKVFLLRGNNELQTNVLLKKELIAKYGQDDGMIIWKSVQEIFSMLPIAVILDENIACCHSGIPVNKTLKNLYDLPQEIMDVERDSIVNEIITRYPSGCTTGNLRKNSKTSLDLPASPDSPGSKSTSSKSSKTKSGSGSGKMKKTKIKSTSSKTAKTKPGSPKSKSLSKTVKSLPPFKSLKSSKSLKSFKSLTTLQRSSSLNLGMKTLKSLMSIPNTKKFKSRILSKIHFKSLRDNKYKISFLKRANRKSMKSTGGKSKKTMSGKKSGSSKQSKSPPKMKTSSPKVKMSSPTAYCSHHNRQQNLNVGRSSSRTSASSQNLRHHGGKTFDQKEFEHFLQSNHLSYLIRSHTLCPRKGYRLDFDNRCLTVFSCSGILKENLNNSKLSLKQMQASLTSMRTVHGIDPAAAVLIDSSNNNIRIVRF